MRNKLSDKWFFSDVSFLVKNFQIYIKGDALVIFPFLILLLVMSFINARFAVILLLVFITLRQLGEMIYWLLQQFGKTGYRPEDFGFKSFSNNAIYVLYQLFALIGAAVALSLLLYFLMIWS